jgi:hypothetical protein
MAIRRIVILILLSVVFFTHPQSAIGAVNELDPYTVQHIFCRFPFAKVVPLDDGDAWGVLYSDTYGKLQLLRWTSKGWQLEWKLASMGTKIRNFFYDDIDADGSFEIIVVTVDGRIIVYRAEDYQNIWENLEDNLSFITAVEIENIDNDPQLEFVVLADSYLYIFDGLNKNRQWVSERRFEASEIIIENVDKDEQLEIILNTGVVIDTRFLNIEVEWDKSFGDRIIVCDMNNDGYPEIIGEFSDYALRIFDVYSQREVW